MTEPAAPTPPSRPDVTPAQLLALTTWIAAQGVAFGWITPRGGQIALSVSATVIAGVWKLADAWIRYGRNRATVPHQLPTTAGS